MVLDYNEYVHQISQTKKNRNLRGLSSRILSDLLFVIFSLLMLLNANTSNVSIYSF